MTWQPTQKDTHGAEGGENAVISGDHIFSKTARAISFGTAGDLKVDLADAEGNVITSGIVIPNGALAAGIMHAMFVTKVYETGTDVIDLVGWF